MDLKGFYDQLSNVMEDLPVNRVCQFYLNSYGEIFRVNQNGTNWMLYKVGYLVSFENHLRVEDCIVCVCGSSMYSDIKEALGASIPLWFSFDKMSGIDKSRRDFLLSCYELLAWIRERV